MRKLAALAALAASLARPAHAGPRAFDCRAGIADGRDRNGDYDAIILRESERRGLNPRLVKAIVAVESQFTPRAVSPRGARGLMQLMPDTAREVREPVRDLADPNTNIRAGTEYLSRLFAASRRRGAPSTRRTTGAEVRRVVAAYHAGPAVLLGRAWAPATKSYVDDVMSCYRSPVSVLHLAGYGRYVRLTSLAAPERFGR